MPLSYFAVMLGTLALHPLLGTVSHPEVWLFILALLGHLLLSVSVFLIKNVRIDQADVFLDSQQLLDDLMLVILLNVKEFPFELRDSVVDGSILDERVVTRRR